MLLCTSNLVTAGFLPQVDFSLIYDDNIRATRDELKQADRILTIDPTLTWQWLIGKHQFDLIYAGGYGFYQDDTDLNYDDHLLTAHTLLDHSYRLNSEFELGYSFSHERPRDTDAAPKLIGESNVWSNKNALGRISYGRDDSKGQIVLQLDADIRRYTNNNQEFRDYDKWGTVGTFYYRIAPNTRLLFEASLADYHYPNEDSTGSNQSNRASKWLTGVSWRATAKTSGELKVGYRSTRYDDDQFGDRSGLALSLEGDWTPNTYTRVNFGAVQEDRQSARAATPGFVYRGLQASIAHGITPRTEVYVDTTAGKTSYEDETDRDYTRLDVSLGVTHDLLRWLDIGMEYHYEKERSDSDRNNYSRNLFMLKASTKFKD